MMVEHVLKPRKAAVATPTAYEIPQFNLPTILFMFAWPTAWFMLLVYGLIGPAVPQGEVVPTRLFLLVIVFGAGAEGVAGLLLLRREGYSLSAEVLRDRIHWRWPQSRKAWGVALFVFVVALALSLAAGPLNAALAKTAGFVPPSWWPPASNPLVEVNGAADVFPDVALEGNFGFVFIYLVIGLVFNVFGEEIFYRGYLLPRMYGVFGHWAWVANGIGFTLKHLYQRWMVPGILVGGLAFAFAAGPLGSLPLAMAYHWLGNFLFQFVFLIRAVLGAG